MIPFTDRELERAWRENLSASNQAERNNALRLLLFYAIECGLKAIIMKRSGLRKCRTDYIPFIAEAKHNINKLLDYLSASKELRLPRQICLPDVADHKNNRKTRETSASQINQVWRYGAKFTGPFTDRDLEEKLLKISEWIKRELRSP